MEFMVMPFQKGLRLGNIFFQVIKIYRKNRKYAVKTKEYAVKTSCALNIL
ncbi:hypothetical protein ACVWYN_000423 [Pedobacter sp. UYP24]